MLLLSVIILLIIVAYAAMLWRLGQGWQRLRAADNTVIPVSVTVLVPARNEEQHIVQCLTDLVHQDYPKQFVQILVMDDGSDDRTAELAEGLALTHPYIKVMRLPDAKGKKQALQRGIDVTLSKLIATVDADCRIAPTWLSTMVAHQQRGQAAMVMGPVVIAPAPTLFERIQRMEFLAIMGVTGGAAANGTPVMANGANLLFLREAFKAVGGYSGSSNPSGDDVFLMLKLKERAASNAALGGVVFAKDARALVSTHAMPSLKAFWQQRKRWLSKKDGYTDRHVKRTAILTYLANVAGLVALIGLFLPTSTLVFDMLTGALVLKTLADLFFIRMASRDLMPTCAMWEIIPAQFFILIYTSLLGIVGNVKQYEWKGRSHRVENNKRMEE